MDPVSALIVCAALVAVYIAVKMFVASVKLVLKLVALAVVIGACGAAYYVTIM